MKWSLVIFLILGLVHIPKNELAQKRINPEFYGVDSDSVPVFHYDIIRNSPDSLCRLSFRLYPLSFIYFNASQETTAFTLNTDYDISRKLSAFVSASLCFTDAYTITDAFTPDMKAGYHFELGGHYYLINSVFKAYQNIGFALKKHGFIYARIPANQVFKLGIAISYNFLNLNTSGYQGNFNAYNVNDPNKQIVNLKSYDFYYDVYSNTIMGYLAVGLDAQLIKDLLINIEGSTCVKKTNKNGLYADFLISPYSYFGNVTIPDNEVPNAKLAIFNVDQFTPRQNIGFRIGYERTGLKKIGFTWGLETGIMPIEGWYWAIKFGIAGNLAR